jgi:hypothetical protein
LHLLERKKKTISQGEVLFNFFSGNLFCCRKSLWMREIASGLPTWAKD